MTLRSMTLRSMTLRSMIQRSSASRSRTVLVAAAAGVAALVLSACTGSSADTSSPADSASSGMGSMAGTTAAAPVGSVGHNQADVGFATDMIPHHAQAVQMADMALESAVNARVKELAARIKTAQEPEISTMTGWLTTWKELVPTATDSMGMDHGAGMMTSADMTRLSHATGATFDRLWVEMMISHHTGALAMARAELVHGQDVAAKTLAGSIVRSQTAQINQMRTLLTALPAG